MSFLDTGGGTLEDILGQQATNTANTITQQYAKRKQQAIAREGATGRLSSGVANYPLGDINASEAGDLGQVQSALSSALAQVPISDYQTQQDDARKRQLAELLGQIGKSSPLEEALGALGTAGGIAGLGAAIFA